MTPKNKVRLRFLPIVMLSMISIGGIVGCGLIPKMSPKSPLTQATEQLHEQAKMESHVYDAGLADQFKAIGQPGIDQLLILLKDKNPKLRAQAVYLLGEMNATSTVPQLTLALRDDEYYVRNEAAGALGKMGTAAQPAIDWLIGAKDDRHPRSVSVELLNEMGEVTIPSLIKAFDDPPINSKLFVIKALGNMGITAKPAAPQLIATLKHPNSEVRVQAAWALVKIATAQNQALPVLTAALQDPDESIRSIAIQTLGALGPTAKPAVPKLLTLLQPSSQTHGTWEQTQAADALAHIGAFPELIKALKSQDALVRWRVAYALGQIEEAAEPMMPALIKALKDPNSEVRLHSVRALGSIGKSAKLANAELKTVASQDPDDYIRGQAVKALKNIENPSLMY